jgi:hypothetical protein
VDRSTLPAVLLLRKIGTVLLSAWCLAWIGRAIFDWILGLEGAAVTVPVIIAALLGAAIGASEARDLEPWAPSKRRDAIIGWGTVIAVVAVIACLAIPMPWGAIAAVTVAVAAIVVLRRVPAVSA